MPGRNGGPVEAEGVDLDFELKVLELIQSYRELGFLIADVDPLHRGIKTHPLLKLDKFGLTDSDLTRTCQVGKMMGIGPVPLQEIIRRLTIYYLSPASVEYGHINDPRSRLWIQKRVESNYLSKPFSPEVKKRALQKLIEAELFESFLHRRFVGQKRFSIEGADVLIAMLDFLISQATNLGANEILLGMAHRGRLNVLANIFQKDLQKMLGEFSGHLDANVGDGDVKYHMGFSQRVQTNGKAVHLSLLPNPSHLEAVNSVLMGVAHAKQKLRGDKEKIQIIPVLLHGDAAFSGQGVVYECLNMSELRGYTVGGTIHIIVNNQIGFTTSPSEYRSTSQATDIAKMLEIPIFHVNADEPESALRCILMALNFRHKFKRDIVIDLVGYRRYGHNESDEPSFTQPMMYKVIKDHPRVRSLYQEKLVKEKVVTEDETENIAKGYEAQLETAFEQFQKIRISPMMEGFQDRWEGFRKPAEKEIFQKVETGIQVELLQEIGQKLIQVPDTFHLNAKIEKILEGRQKILDEQGMIDWPFAEALAIASLLWEGHFVRLAGQDSERGTFSQRHSVYHDMENGEKYNPYNDLKKGQGKFEVVNSLLSEYGALGFEFGQSMANPKELMMWEAQYGDFINGAQIIIDQFLVASAYKWNRFSGLVLLLPHGYEGQGPEHSSGRLERFLKACAQNNIQVCNVTTPAQYFHLLRRQILRMFRIPLVIMTPKSLLRNPHAVSPLVDFEKSCFEEVLTDSKFKRKKEHQVKRILFCSGKIFYALAEAREKQQLENIALIRVEQLYPFPKKKLTAVLEAFPNAQEIVWCQEGPQNMEGWEFISQNLPPLLQGKQKLLYAGGAPQASPANSYLHLHLNEQKRIVQQGLGIL